VFIYLVGGITELGKGGTWFENNFGSSRGCERDSKNFFNGNPWAREERDVFFMHMTQGLAGVVAVVGIEDCLVRFHGSEGWGDNNFHHMEFRIHCRRVGWPLGAFGAFGAKGFRASGPKLGPEWGRGAFHVFVAVHQKNSFSSIFSDKREKRKKKWVPIILTQEK